ncbi:hypothetical protein Dsin_013848 [Dipteronia sinensis]|uniref:Uncharacterized protein n=1 Tax=Dipteronia sinensis TaxID=43782 RepID=A0AAE0E995_9ROSI|nr:hypothetical protein Dsin_013848 [Dipteronia sinensis]
MKQGRHPPPTKPPPPPTTNATTTTSSTEASPPKNHLPHPSPSTVPLPASPPPASTPPPSPPPIATPSPPPPSPPTTTTTSSFESSYRCVSSVLKKDGQMLSIAAFNGYVYTGSESNVIRVWKLPEFTECGQLKTKTAMVVALEVSPDRVYAAYSDGRIRVWRRTWDNHALRHIRLATIPRTGGYVRSYIIGKDKTTKHMGPITSLAINISDEILYSASLDKTVKVWRITDFKCIETIQAHSEPINALAVAD